MFALATALLSALPQVDRPVRSELARCAEFLAGDLVEHEGVTALSVCIRIDGATWAAIARGFVDAEHSAPVDAGTRFPVGSLTRVFNAAGVMLEVARGTLALDDELAQRLPAPFALAQPVRLRWVLEGTSGIAPWSRVFANRARELEPPRDSAALLALVAAAPFDSAPGAEYAPNSAAWALLPPVLERAWGQPYAAGLREHVLAPAGLVSTGVCAEVDATLGAVRDCEAVAAAHDRELELARSAPTVLPTLCTSAGELAAWFEALGSGRIVDAPQLASLTTAARTTSGRSTGHGFALDLDVLEQHPRWWHSGGIGNFRARASWYPSDDVAIAVLANCARADVDALETELARFVLGLRATRELDLPLTPAECARFTGAYQIGTTRVRIAARGTHLAWQDPDAERECVWQGRTCFVGRGDGDFVLRFDVDGERARGFQLQRDGTTVTGVRVD